MGQPKRDSAGRVLPFDDETIGDDDYILRDIPDSQFLPGEGDGGRRRLSSGAFSPTSKGRDPYQGMSADLLSALKKGGYSEQGRKSEAAGVAKINVGELRKLQLRVGRDDQGRGDPYHVSVWGVGKSQKKEIREIATLTKKPADVL